MNRVLRLSILWLFLPILITGSSIFYGIVSGYFLQIKLEVLSEIDTRFLIRPNHTIIYSRNTSRSYQLHSIKNGFHRLISKEVDVFNPFFYSGRVLALRDSIGNENFQSLGSAFNEKNIKSVFTFKNGNLAIFQTKKSIYLVEVGKNTRQLLLDNIQILHSATIYEPLDLLIINYDNKLVSRSLLTGSVDTLDTSSSTQTKMNSYVYLDTLYYCNNRISDLYQISTINLRDGGSTPQVVYHSSHDVRMPQFYGNDLFFVEVINNEYLLRQINISTKKVTNITKRGVVYAYKMYGDKQLVISYSDISIAKSLINFDMRKKSYSKIAGDFSSNKIECKFIRPIERRSPAYLINSKNDYLTGIVLFIHPGEDFSPRWDPILISLALNGYLILAPNYRGSYGYGKMYQSCSLENSAEDITKWKAHLKSIYPKLPLYYLSYSSGNKVMETALNENNTSVNGAISFFGIPSGFLPEYNTPSKYILGENDSRVDFNDRKDELDIASTLNKEISITSYESEGHYLRKSKNIESAITEVIQFMYEYK